MKSEKLSLEDWLTKDEIFILTEGIEVALEFILMSSRLYFLYKKDPFIDRSKYLKSCRVSAPISVKNLFPICFTILLSAISQIGDLIISFLKRKAKIKDTGSFLPGHGGLLDRADGILLTLPIGLIIVNI